MRIETKESLRLSLPDNFEFKPYIVAIYKEGKKTPNYIYVENVMQAYTLKHDKTDKFHIVKIYKQL